MYLWVLHNIAMQHFVHNVEWEDQDAGNLTTANTYNFFVLGIFKVLSTPYLEVHN